MGSKIFSNFSMSGIDMMNFINYLLTSLFSLGILIQDYWYKHGHIIN